MPIYEEKRTVKGQKRYFVRTYVTDELGISKQVTKHNKNWIGREGKLLAQQEEIRLKTKVKRKSYNSTFEQIVDIYLKDAKEKNKESTYVTYENAIKCFLIDMPFYKKKMKYYSEADNNYFRKKLESENYTLNYKNKIHCILKSILDMAIRRNELDRNFEEECGPFKQNIETIVTDEEKIKYITYEDFKKIMNTEKDIKWYAYFNTLFFTGMRKGESLAITWEDIDFKNKEITINKTYTNKTKGCSYKITSTKNLINRKIKLNDSLINILSVYKNEMKPQSNKDFVFCGNAPLSTSTIGRKWDSYFSNNDIPKITIHQIRHSNVSFLINEYLKSGQTDTTKFFIIMSKRLGHTIKVMQETYMHLFPEFQDQVVDLLNFSI